MSNCCVKLMLFMWHKIGSSRVDASFGMHPRREPLLSVFVSVEVLPQNRAAQVPVANSAGVTGHLSRFPCHVEPT
jgi:hypothetical protein